MNFSVVNILDLLEIIGETSLSELFSTFSCTKNSEIEYFLKNNSINFAKRKMAITYLILDDENKLAAYFSITHKALEFLYK